MAAIETHQQAAAAATSDNNGNARPAAKLLDPQLLMAARRGDSKRLKELLLGANDDDDSGMEAEAKQVVVVEVDRRRPAEVAPPPLRPLDGDGVTTAEAGDSLLHVVAASGDSHELLDCATMIHDHISKGLLVARNNKGDTPLHCAAGAGNAHMISRLVALVTGDDKAVKAFLRLQNHLGETALHHAVRAASKPAIDQLLSLDSELACSSIIPVPGEEVEGGKVDAGAASASSGSPFYLAVSLGEMDIARHLFRASSSRSKRKLSYYSGPYGRNVLHAAVSRGQVLAEILKWLKDEVVDVPAAEAEGDVVGLHVVQSCLPLVSQLSSQRDMQQKGSTPLHLAASLDWWLRWWFLHNVFRQETATTRLLLDANVSTAYQADDEGSYPIHAAAWAGSLGVVKTLLERCPDCATLRDGKGRTFLHVAVEQERLRVVAYAAVRGRLTSLVLNAQEDMNGDTALHVAVRRPENLGLFNCLLGNPQVRLDVANKLGMTPLDLSWTMIPGGLYYVLNPRAIVSMSLVAAGAPHGVCRPDLLLEKLMPKTDIVEESKKHTKATQVTSLVTALIATVTFAAAFTLPGGYAAAGTPVLAGSYAFDAFIVADTLAFISSIVATFLLAYAGLPFMDLSRRTWYLRISVPLFESSAVSMVAAFPLALYIVLAPLHRTATAVVVFASAIFLAESIVILATFIIGNVGAWDVITMARTVCARNGILRGLGPVLYTSGTFQATAGVLLHFVSYMMIFFVPAVLKLRT